MLVAGMNRLRAAYVAMDPSIKDHLVTGWTTTRPVSTARTPWACTERGSPTSWPVPSFS
jgi:hypothetical protein